MQYGQMEQYAKIAEIAKIFRVGESTIRQWIRAGLLEAVRLNKPFGCIRVSMQSVSNFIDRYSRKQTGETR